jgi:hypothetical protein
MTKWIGAAVVGTVALTITLFPIREVFSDDEPMLSEGLRRIAHLIDETFATAAPDRIVSPTRNSVDIKLARQLRDNHSFADHSDSIRFPHYNDCDSWENIVDDGWQAIYGARISLRGEQDAQQFLADTLRLWTLLGHEVELVTRPYFDEQVIGLSMDVGYATLRVHVTSMSATIEALTECLPAR